ncbi:TPA: DUF805 domain-containing protein [Citrobacter freundii]|nr:DUF805 domain-containing protein [Citrobacter freundii]
MYPVRGTSSNTLCFLNALVVRRLHDIDRSGWWGCVFFVPVIGPFVLLYFLSQQGDSYAQSAGRT